MDDRRFDTLTRSLANRGSRRSAVKALAGSVAAAAALHLPGRAARIAAQDATPAAMPVATPVATPAATGGDPQFLFVQLAGEGGWAPKPGEPDVYLLTLTGVGAQTLYFSDRPDRIYGTMATDVFLDRLGFDEDNPPNAAVVVQTPDGQRDVLVVELFNPVYTRSYGIGGQEYLTYEVRVLAAYAEPDLAEWSIEVGDGQLPPEFSSASLFIDDCPDSVHCWRRVGASSPYRPDYIGPIPGGPYGRCYDWGAWKCLPCQGQPSWGDMNEYCNLEYVDQCNFWCDTNV